MKQADINSHGPDQTETNLHGHPHPGWLIALGIATLLTGFAAIAFPLASTLAIEILVGFLFLTIGLMTMAHAFMEKGWKGFLWALLIGCLYILAGIAFLANPLGGVLTLTVMLGVVFLAEGILRIVLGFQMRPNNRWGLMIASGAMSILLAIMVLAGLANGSSLLVIGIMVGINFIFAGAALIQIGLGARQGQADTPSDAIENTT